jgi:putative ABC transport system permease protein
MALGLALLTTLEGLRLGMETALDGQARELLGADVVIESRRPFRAEDKAWLETLGETRVEETNLSTMVMAPRSGVTRLAQVCGVGKGYPLYGRLDTDPPAAAQTWSTGKEALLEASLSEQLNVGVGDEIHFGGKTFRVAGTIRRAPSKNFAFNALAPRLYVSLAEMPQTQLGGMGSLARYSVAVRLPAGTQVSKLVATWKPRLIEGRMTSETVVQRQEQMTGVFDRVTRFLSVLGFVAVMLGGLAVAQTSRAHIREQQRSIAVLRCLGAPSWRLVAAYAGQVMLLGVISAIAGLSLGMFFYAAVIAWAQDLYPLAVSPWLPWRAGVWGTVLGLILPALFAWEPLRRVGKISPLAAWRQDEELTGGSKREWRTYAVTGLGLVGLAMVQAHSWKFGLGLAALAGGALAILGAASWMVLQGTRWGLGRRGPFVWRQGWLGLSRPGNRTTTVLVALGLGLFLTMTLALLEHQLQRDLAVESGSNPADLVLFGLQPAQREALGKLVKDSGAKTTEETLMVPMRLVAIKNRPVTEILANPKHREPDWMLRREFRSGYRATLRPSEKLKAGKWQGAVRPGEEPIPVSVEEGMAKDLQVTVGDRLEFEVQGVRLKTVVGSLREVNWKRFEPNFFVLFPTGVLEEAPGFGVAFVQAGGATGKLQRRVVEQFPNVTMVDLTLVLQTMSRLLSQASQAVQGLMGLVVLTGWLVSWGALEAGLHQRVRDYGLLRVLGASRRQLWCMMGVEFGLLGALAGMVGLGLAVGATAALAHWSFESEVAISWSLVVAAELAVIGLTGLVGGLQMRQITRLRPRGLLN